MYCSKCGKEITNNGEFCEHCRTRIKSVNSSTKNSTLSAIILVIGAIIIVIISVLGIVNVFKGINNEYEESLETLDDMQNSISFNCPYCRKRITVNKKNLIDLTDSYSYYCTNCGKGISINKDTGEVTVSGY